MLDLLPFFGQINALKNKKVVKFFPLKTFHNLLLKLGNSARERKENNKEIPSNLAASCSPCKEKNHCL